MFDLDVHMSQNNMTLELAVDQVCVTYESHMRYM
jgi:hypothetical protein